MLIKRKYTYGDGTTEIIEDEIPDNTLLEEMTTAELKTIMADKGIATTMTKDNMVTLIKATE